MSKRGIRDIDLLIYCIAEERRPRRRETSAAASAAASFLTRRAGNSLEMRKIGLVLQMKVVISSY